MNSSSLMPPAIAAMPAASPSMLSRRLNAFVIATIQNIVTRTSAIGMPVSGNRSPSVVMPAAITTCAMNLLHAAEAAASRHRGPSRRGTCNRSSTQMCGSAIGASSETRTTARTMGGPPSRAMVSRVPAIGLGPGYNAQPACHPFAQCRGHDRGYEGQRGGKAQVKGRNHRNKSQTVSSIERYRERRPDYAQTHGPGEIAGARQPRPRTAPALRGKLARPRPA